MTTFSYGPSDLPGGAVNPATLTSEYQASSIVIALERIDTEGGSVSSGVVTGGVLRIVTKAPLTQADRTTLDGTTVPNVLATQTDGTLVPAPGTTHPNVLGIQANAALDPGASPVLGDRYVVLDAANLHANFGAPAGVENNDIVEYDGDVFVVSLDASSVSAAKVKNLADGTFHRWNGAAWAAVAPGTVGDRYLILAASMLHTGFGAISGVEDNDIVEHDGSAFYVALDASAVGSAVVQSDDDYGLEAWDGATWQPAAATGLLAAHNNAPSAVIAPKPKVDGDGVTYSKPQPQTLGYELNDRDFKLVTCRVTQAAAVEDLKINVATLKEEPYLGPELALVGVYKNVAGDMVPVADQTDADLNGVLSVFEYKAYDQQDGTTQIPFNIRSGAIINDIAIPTAERFLHRAYVVAVPGLGSSYYVRLFDGYLAGHPDGILDVESPQAKLLDPTPAPGVSNAIRIYIYHPAGQSNTHILWLLTYRPGGTF